MKEIVVLYTSFRDIRVTQELPYKHMEHIEYSEEQFNKVVHDAVQAGFRTTIDPIGETVMIYLDDVLKAARKEKSCGDM